MDVYMCLRRDGYDCAITKVPVYRDVLYVKNGEYRIEKGGIKTDNPYCNLAQCLENHCYFTKEELIAAHPMLCPEKGSFVAYKKIGYLDCLCIAKLLVPSDALRTSGYLSGGKIRVSKALVTDIYDVEDSAKKYKCGYSIYHHCTGGFYYKVGKYAYVNCFDDRREMICSYGIHAFMTENEARNYEG